MPDFGGQARYDYARESASGYRYDLMNDLMTAGLHRAWKDDFVTAVNPPRGAQPFRLLDVAGGTGDIAFRIVEAGGVGTAASGDTNQGEGQSARPSTRAIVHLGARHVVTHSYATTVEFEINQPRVNKALIINARIRGPHAGQRT